MRDEEDIMSERRNRISTTANTGNIGCPFFIAHGRKDIRCEGLLPGSRICTEFEEEDEKAWHQLNYCEKCYKRCEIYCSIQHWKWEDE